MSLLRHQDYARRATYDADVLVIGTGAGGAAAGATLAEAGLDVLFVEEGSYHPTGSFNPYVSESIPRLYRDCGTTSILGTPNIPYMEGRCVGGTTVINGGMAYRAPEQVLSDWERTLGDPSLGPAGMASLFDEVERSVHATHQDPASVGDDSRLMYLGAQRKGWKSTINRRNQDRCVGTNNCIYGCPTGAKQSTLVSYMPRAIEAGARCLTEVRIDRLIIEGGRCVGAHGRATDPRTRKPDQHVTLRARAVVVSCGAIHTPYLLMRHKLGRPSRQLGQHFLCHPNAKIVAVYPDRLDAWKGVSQWSQVREFHDDGVLFAENMVPPSPLGAAIPWHGNQSLRFLERYNDTVVTGVLVEDSTSGHVRRGPMGMPIVRYDISAWDRTRFVRGVRHLAELHFEMGAEALLLPYQTHHLVRSMDEVRAIDEERIRRRDLELFTVHLMGTARLGARAEASVVDLSGQLWDLPGCYVADASIFPSAIGVNPQITIMALATRIGRRLADQLLRRRARRPAA